MSGKNFKIILLKNKRAKYTNISYFKVSMGILHGREDVIQELKKGIDKDDDGTMTHTEIEEHFNF